MSPLEALPESSVPSPNAETGGGFSFGDLTTIPEGEDKFPVLPPGPHDLELESGGLKIAETTGNIGLNLQFCCNYNAIGYKLFHSIWRQTPGGKPIPNFVLQIHRDLLIALGLPLKMDFSNEQALNDTVAACVGKKVRVVTKIKKDKHEEYDDQATIKKVVGPVV